MNIDFSKLHWIEDNNGYKFGYPDVSIIGRYALDKYGLELFIDVDDMTILEAYVYIHEGDCIDDDDNCVRVSNEFLTVITNALKQMGIIYD
ncbi:MULTISPECIES: hypothetical protein [unclassified Staphylococcus]|uniref:hypothetical protein n=1 Tax=unclassified Staphylococcus TaxID=91994 RepID=UPI00122E7690|nr:MULTISPECIES: hypothetical protein [unclassified Staphylococcus]KAA2278085.1 hypothetical protein F1592_00755 [Staphylococcus sp. GDX7P312P]KAA2281478.1 hypothetical protein F1591_03250 [Staphylococcus sp. GDX7P459A]